MGGMLFGTIFGVVVIPGLYYIFGTLADGKSLIRKEETEPLTETYKYNTHQDDDDEE
jgi:HAE1 family hydrophobic/amphiphilic exporter-1